MEKRTVSNLGRGGGDGRGLNQAVNHRSEFVDGPPPSPHMVTVEVDGPAAGGGRSIRACSDLGLWRAPVHHRTMPSKGEAAPTRRGTQPGQSSLGAPPCLPERQARATTSVSMPSGCGRPSRVLARSPAERRSRQAYRAARRVSGAVSSGAKTCSTTIRTRR
jgi:hypothetical protein